MPYGKGTYTKMGSNHGAKKKGKMSYGGKKKKGYSSMKGSSAAGGPGESVGKNIYGAKPG